MPPLKTSRRLQDPEEDTRGDNRTVYDRMKADIFSFALQPGQDIDEVSLSRRYGVSRTPVREAMIRLAADRLVIFGANRRASVTALILSDYPRFFEALDFTRRGVSRLAALRRTPADLDRINGCLAALVRSAKGAKSGSYEIAHAIVPPEIQLCIAIGEASHNSYVMRSYEQLLTVGHRMLHIPYGYDARPSEPLKSYVSRIVARHSALVSAIATENADAAEEEARALTADLVTRLRSYLEENLAADISIQLMPG